LSLHDEGLFSIQNAFSSEGMTTDSIPAFSRLPMSGVPFHVTPELRPIFSIIFLSLPGSDSFRKSGPVEISPENSPLCVPHEGDKIRNLLFGLQSASVNNAEPEHFGIGRADDGERYGCGPSLGKSFKFFHSRDEELHSRFQKEAAKDVPAAPLPGS
jgi:hypothetical protein